MKRYAWTSALLLAVGSAILLQHAWNSSPGGRTPDGFAPHPEKRAVARMEEREREGEGASPSGAYDALSFWTQARAYPGVVVPDAAYAVAFEEVRARRQAADGGATAALDDLVAPWSSLGPANIGGRTLALAVRPDNPDVIFAGSASGGLWKTTSGGVGADAWDRVEIGFPVLGVSCIALDPGDPDVMYIGTGEVYQYDLALGGEAIRTTRGSYGFGLFKSTDGGASWTHSLDWSYEDSHGVWAIAVDPTDSDVVFAATSEGIYRSLDAGASWTRVLDVLMGTDVRIRPDNTDHVLAACGNFGSAGHGIYRSLDGGETWTKLSLGLPSSWTGKVLLDIAPSSPGTVFASIADQDRGVGLYRSTNFGTSWERRTSLDYPQYQGWYSHWVLVDRANPDRVFIGGIEIHRSTNGGSTFTELSDWTSVYFGQPPAEGPYGDPDYAHADHHFALRHPTDNNTFFFASDGGVFKTTNGGSSFIGLNGGYVTGQFYNGFSSSSGNPDLAIGGMQDNFTAIYVGSNEWVRVIGGDGCMTATHPTDDDILYATYQYLGLARSTNGGVDWDFLSVPEGLGDQTAFVAPYVLSPSSPNVLYAGRSRVYKSTNQGTSWTATNGGVRLDGANMTLTMAISSTDVNVVYCSTAPTSSGRARLFRTRNGGTLWTDVTGTLPDRYYADIAVDPNDDDVVYVALHGFGTPHLYRSANGGDTWTDISGSLPDVPTTAVTVDPDHPDILYVGNDLGIFVSLDGGVSWHAFQNGMPTAMVNDLVVFEPDRVLRAATHGNGVYQRDMLDPSVTDVASLTDAGTGTTRGEGVSLSVHPNPVSTQSRVHFRLPEAGEIRVALYEVTGRRRAVLAEGAWTAGEHEIALDAQMTGSGRLAPGVYFVRLETARGIESTRVVLSQP